MRRVLFTLLFFLTLAPLSVPAQESEDPALGLPSSLPRRPKIGLALGGGGAKGMSQVGVLKVMAEVGIPIDYICGTSIGSIMGALTSLGYSADQLDSIVRNIDWPTYMRDNVPSRYLSYQAREDKSKYLFTIPFSTDAPLRQGIDKITSAGEESGSRFDLVSTLPAGLVSGSNVVNLLNNLSVGYQDSLDFIRDLPIPFSCVAINLVDGSQEVLTSGKLPYAIRSSMAIPGVFPPVRSKGKVLIDGGMVNNFPVDVCRRMGADIVIGVNLANKRATREELNSLPQLLAQLLNVLTSPTTEQNARLCNIYIHPDMSGFSSMSFDPESVDELIRRGYAAADAQRDNFIKLRQLLDKCEEAPAPKRRFPEVRSLMTRTITLDTVSIEDVSPQEERWLLRRMGIKAGQVCKGARLQEVAYLLKGIGIFNNVAYDTTPTGEGDHFNVSYRMTRSRSHYLKFGLRFDSQEAVMALLNFGWRENELSGFRFGLNAKLSFNPEINLYASYCAPQLVRANFDYSFKKSEYSIWNSGLEQGTQKYNRHALRLYLSQFRMSAVGFKLGLAGESYVTRTMYNSEFPEAILSLPSTNFVYLKSFGEVGANTLDKEYFPTSGVKADLKGEWFLTDFGASRRYGIVEPFKGFGSARLRFQSYIPTGQGRFVISPQIYARGLFGPSIPLEGGYDALHWCYYGGDMAGRYFEDQLPFIGTNSARSAYENIAIGRIDLRYNVRGPHYVSLLGNVLYSFEKSEILDGQYLDMFEWGAALRYSLSTSFGPISLDFQWASKPQFSFLTTRNSRFSIYFSAGFNF